MLILIEFDVFISVQSVNMALRLNGTEILWYTLIKVLIVD